MTSHNHSSAAQQLKVAAHQLTKNLRHHVGNTLPRLMTPIDWANQSAILFAARHPSKVIGAETSVQPSLTPD